MTVPIDLDFYGDVKSQLSKFREQSGKKGVQVRALLITNPSNPTGEILPEKALVSIAEWCAENKIHLIAYDSPRLCVPTGFYRNEVYANSVMYNDPVPYRSLFEIAKSMNHAALTDRLHYIYSISKDCCASGLRIAWIYTDSQGVLSQLKFFSPMTCASFPIQQLMTKLLGDKEFIADFIHQNTARLKNSYKTLTSNSISHENRRTFS